MYPRLLLSQKEKSKADVVTGETIARINQDMQAVVNDPNGTANSLQSLGISLMAKPVPQR